MSEGGGVCVTGVQVSIHIILKAAHIFVDAVCGFSTTCVSSFVHEYL